MAPRNSKIDKKEMVENDDYDEEENSASFQDEVEQELAFMQQFPVSDFDNTARKEAEIEREIVFKKNARINKILRWTTAGNRISKRVRKT